MRRLVLGLALVCVGMPAHAIVGGVPSGDEDDRVVLVSSARSPVCTGTLLAPNLVLTARHCVSTIDDAHVECDAEGRARFGGAVAADGLASTVKITRGPVPKLDPDAYGVRLLVPSTTNMCNSDLAFVVLDRAVPNASIASIRIAAPPVEGERLRLVGYGASNDSAGFTRRARANVPVTAVGPYGILGNGIGSNELSIGEGACHGDSGGPAFSEATGALVGVDSRGGNGVDVTFAAPAASCVNLPNGGDAYNVYTTLPGFRALVDEAFAAAGATPWIEGEPDPNPAPTLPPAMARGCSLGGRAHARGPGAIAWVLIAFVALGRRRIVRAQRSRSVDAT